MSLIYLIFTLLLVIINLIGITLIGYRYLPYYLLAKVVGVMTICLAFFFIEHFIGLGSLDWLWPISTAMSLYLLYRNRVTFRQSLWRQELVFIIALVAYVAWKYTFPDIDPHSEQLSDLSMISSYFPGHTLPPMDYWDPQQHLDMYYTFQFYAAALMGRVLKLFPGYAMNLAICVIMAMLASLSWFIASRFNPARWSRLLIVLAVMVGGTGIAPLTHFLFKQTMPGQSRAFIAESNIWANTRFIGLYDHQIDTSFGKQLFDTKNIPVSKRDLPLETMGYLTVLGDYHPPLGGFLILFVALACISLLSIVETQASWPILQGIFAATVPLSLITNTWVFPLQTALFAGWLVYRILTKTPPNWKAILIGLVGCLLCIYPFLTYFAANALHPHIRWVSAADHTPWREFLAVHWPELIFLLAASIGLRHDHKKLWLFVLFAILLILSELIYVDDPLQGTYNRFNTTLKWWSWLYPAIILMSGTLLISMQRWYRWLAIAVLLLISTFSLDMFHYWEYSPKPSIGRLRGDYWLTRNSIDNAMIKWLNAMPTGVVLENIGAHESYTRCSTFALFSRKPSALGWPDHETQWRHDNGWLYNNANLAKSFYHGRLQHALAWLNYDNIDYIVWTGKDQQQAPNARQIINNSIRSQFYWIPFFKHDAFQYGLWYRKSISFLR